MSRPFGEGDEVSKDEHFKRPIGDTLSRGYDGYDGQNVPKKMCGDIQMGSRALFDMLPWPWTKIMGNIQRKCYNYMHRRLC